MNNIGFLSDNQQARINIRPTEWFYGYNYEEKYENEKLQKPSREMKYYLKPYDLDRYANH
jgi:hypothetical protein